eukprot:858428_1
MFKIFANINEIIVYSTNLLGDISIPLDFMNLLKQLTHVPSYDEKNIKIIIKATQNYGQETSAPPAGLMGMMGLMGMFGGRSRDRSKPLRRSWMYDVFSKDESNIKKAFASKNLNIELTQKQYQKYKEDWVTIEKKSAESLTHLLKTQLFKLDSMILSLPQEQNDFVSLLQYKLGNIANLTLLYRASTDGFNHKSFLEKAETKECTLLLIENEFNYKFGGYSQVMWSGEGGYVTDYNAFLFQIRPHCKAFGIDQTKPRYAVCHQVNKDGNDVFPYFGLDAQLCLANDCNINQNSYCFEPKKNNKTYQCKSNELCGGHVHINSKKHWNFKVNQIELFHVEWK